MNDTAATAQSSVTLPNPVTNAVKARIPKKTLGTRVSATKDRIVTKDQLRILIRVAYDEYARSFRFNASPIHHIVHFLASSGLRPGELYHMSWSEVDSKNGLLTIGEKPNCPTKYGIGWSTKTTKSKWPNRTIRLFPEALKILQERYENKPDVVFGLIDKGKDESGRQIFQKSPFSPYRCPMPQPPAVLHMLCGKIASGKSSSSPELPFPTCSRYLSQHLFRSASLP